VTQLAGELSGQIAGQLASLVYTDVDGEHSFVLKRGTTTIGRSPDENLVLPESFVSRQHAVIEEVNGSWILQDPKSSHGTYVNGARVKRAELKPGDLIQFGSPQAPRMRFQMLSSSAGRAGRSMTGDLLSALNLLAPSAHVQRPAAREMEQLNFLLSAARQLNAGGAIADIFHALVQLSIQLTGVERGFVFLCEGDQLRLALGLTADGREVTEDSTVSRSAMKKALEKDATFFVTDTFADDNASAWVSVVVNSIRSIYCIPLRKRTSPTAPNRLMGLLYLDSQIGVGKLSDIDHQVLDTVAVEASTLLHNALLAEAELKARLAAEELAVAAKIHASLMSMALPTLDYAVLKAKSVPCLEIGGDFYDAVALEDCVCVAIADVSGKGVPASIVAATLQGIIHAQLLTRQSLAEIAALVNRFLCTRRVGKYATMVLLKLYPDGEVEYINCGHIAPLVVSKDKVRSLEDGNLIVGLISGAEYVSSRCRLSAGERILLTTDGITEAEDAAGRQFGEVALEDAALLDALDDIVARVAAFQSPKEAQDDLTLLAVEYRGA
jgi:serine phosphatase RsbU (regulator of sigma subunit)